MKDAPKTVIYFAAGQIAAFDAQGQQISELQEPPILLWVKHAAALGYDMDGIMVESEAGMLRIFKTVDGWNWEVKR